MTYVNCTSYRRHAFSVRGYEFIFPPLSQNNRRNRCIILSCERVHNMYYCIHILRRTRRHEFSVSVRADVSKVNIIVFVVYTDNVNKDLNEKKILLNRFIRTNSTETEPNGRLAFRRRILTRYYPR